MRIMEVTIVRYIIPSSMDHATDDLMQEIIRDQFRGCAVITIAHRVRTIMDYDQVIVLDKGVACDIGNPQTLLLNILDSKNYVRVTQK
jgi:ABC-type multidrug transport system fused ATPase/permease subunit